MSNSSYSKQIFGCHIMRSSHRLSSSRSASDFDSCAEDELPAPKNDPVWTAEDKRWRSLAVNKPVYFRWSTAHSSKNRFKGMVVGHKSRSRNGERVDYLGIKTFGFSEDQYVMGKDIRELFLMASKGVLIEAKTEEDVRRGALKRWSWKEGWMDLVEGKSMERGVVAGKSMERTEAKGKAMEKPPHESTTHAHKSTTQDLLESSTRASSTVNSPQSRSPPSVGARTIGKRKPKPSRPSISSDHKSTTLPSFTGIHVEAKHSGSCLVGRIEGFSFAEGLFSN